MNTFDFHFHPLFKRFVTKFDDAARQNRNCTLPVRLPGPGSVIDALVGHILENQASVAQTLANKPVAAIRLGAAAVLAMEYVFASRQGLLKLLELEILNFDVVAVLDTRFVDFVKTGAGSYAQLLDKEIAFYQWVAKATGLRHEIKLLTRKQGQPVANQLDPEKLNMVLAIEGGHSLSENLIRQDVGPIDPVGRVIKYRLDPEVDFLYLTLTHLSHIAEQRLCSHAFGFKLVKNMPDARPKFGGLTELGRAVVQACVDLNINEYPILIDVKHMSALGREQFYAYRHRLLAEPPAGFKPPAFWPIVATHVGVTGFRRQRLRDHLAQHGVEAANPFSVRMRVNRERAGQFKEGVFKENVFFNASSINLFDEDIEEVARSGGLIGISLDARVLGFQGLQQRTLGGPDHDFDYYSREDFATYFPDLSGALPPLPEAEEAVTPPGVEVAPLGQEVLGQASRRTRELYLFCLNVLHVVAVIQALGASAPRPAWEFVCLGSDYDGLIDSIKAARTVEQLPGFRVELLEFFPKAEKAYRKLRPEVGQLLPGAGGSLDLEVALDALFYGNGHQFMKTWWG